MAERYNPLYERPNPLNPNQIIPRVVIVGVGELTSLGPNVRATLDGHLLNANGVVPVAEDGRQLFVEGRVRGFNPDEVLAPIADEKQRRRMVPMQKFEAAVTLEASRDAHLLETTSIGEGDQRVEREHWRRDLLEKYRLGVLGGTGAGGTTGYAKNALLVNEGKSRRLNPFTDVSGTFIDQAVTKVNQLMRPPLAGATQADEEDENEAVASYIESGFIGAALGTNSAACASSALTTAFAYNAIVSGELDIVTILGAEAPHNVVTDAMFIRTRATSLSKNPDTASIPGHTDRDGFVVGEGAGALIATRADIAAQQGLYAYAELGGFANVSGIGHQTEPFMEAMYQAHMIALGMLGIKEGEDVYYNAHMTSTKNGDVVEPVALKKVLQRLNLGKASVFAGKGFYAHNMGAAAIVETASMLGAMRRGITLGNRQPSYSDGYSRIEQLDGLDFFMGWRHGKPDVMLKGSFGFGDQNFSLAFRKIDGTIPFEKSGRVFTRPDFLNPKRQENTAA